MSTRYYLGFESSSELASSADTILENYTNKDPSPQVIHYEKLVSHFVPELLQAFLIETCDAVGLSPRASKVVHGASDTISRTSTALVSKLLAKRSNDELIPMTEFVEETYLHDTECSNQANTVGCEIEKDLFDEMKFVIGEIQAGRSESVKEQLHQLMIKVVDVVLEGFMVRAIDLLKINFVLRKICNAAVATCRGAGHMVVNRVFKKLDEDQLQRLAAYFDKLLVSADR